MNHYLFEISVSYFKTNICLIHFYKSTKGAQLEEETVLGRSTVPKPGVASPEFGDDLAGAAISYPGFWFKPDTTRGVNTGAIHGKSGYTGGLLVFQDLNYGGLIHRSFDVFFKKTKGISSIFPFEKIASVCTFNTAGNMIIHGYSGPE